jgi:dUTP pyrophosphatase
MANSMGIIDNSYSGDADEWMCPVVAIRDTVIHKNDRICQFRIVKNQPSITFEVVDHLNENSRGGIGSTGKV